MPGMQDASAGSTAARRKTPDNASDLAVAYRNQAIMLARAGRSPSRRRARARRSALRPDDIDVLNELGVAVWRQGRAAEAEPIYRRACQIKPDDFRILDQPGTRPHGTGPDRRGRRILPPGARSSSPTRSTRMMNLGIVLSDQGKFDEAMDWLFGRTKLRPDSADALQNLGMNLARQGRWDEAIDYYEQALRLRPDFAEVHRNLAVRLALSRRLRARLARARMAIEVPTPIRVVGSTARSGTEMTSGTGRSCSTPSKGSAIPCNSSASPRWSSSAAARSWCSVQPPLLRLVARCAGVDLAFDGTSYEPDCHVHAPLMSLPAIFGTTLATLPAQVPYLATDAVLVDHWRSELARAIGIEGATGAEARSGSAARPARETVPDRDRLARKSRPSTAIAGDRSPGPVRPAGRAAGRPADQLADRPRPGSARSPGRPVPGHRADRPPRARLHRDRGHHDPSRPGDHARYGGGPPGRGPGRPRSGSPSPPSATGAGSPAATTARGIPP